MNRYIRAMNRIIFVELTVEILINLGIFKGYLDNFIDVVGKLPLSFIFFSLACVCFELACK